MRPPLFRARKVPGTMIQSKHGDAVMQHGRCRDPTPLVSRWCSLMGGFIDIEFKPIAMRHPLSPILSALFCNKPPTSKVLSCPEERPIYGRLQDSDGY